MEASSYGGLTVHAEKRGNFVRPGWSTTGNSAEGSEIASLTPMLSHEHGRLKTISFSMDLSAARVLLRLAMLLLPIIIFPAFIA